MPQYETLTDDDLRELHAQRVRDLEAEHYRHRLRLAEAIDPGEAAGLARIVNDLKRRIDLHVGGIPGEAVDGHPQPPAAADDGAPGD